MAVVGIDGGHVRQPDEVCAAAALQRNNNSYISDSIVHLKEPSQTRGSKPLQSRYCRNCEPLSIIVGFTDMRKKLPTYRYKTYGAASARFRHIV